MNIETKKVKLAQIKLNPNNPRRKIPYRQTCFVCEVCGKEFKSKKACASRTPKYCSIKCSTDGKKGKHLGGVSVGKIPWNKGINMWSDKPHPRGTLGMKFPNRKPITKEQRKRLSDSHRGLKYPTKTGEKSHLWRGGVTPENEKQRKSAEYRNWRLAVFERDLYICQDCHKQGGYLHAHHVQGFSEIPDLRYDISNGTTLCMDCHAKRHGLNFSIKAQNHCPDCGKRIKVGAKRCLLCQKAFTESNRNKCIDCGTVIQRVSKRCRSCAAKINIKKTGHVDFWRYKKCNTKSNICQSATLF